MSTSQRDPRRSESPPCQTAGVKRFTRKMNLGAAEVNTIKQIFLSSHNSAFKLIARYISMA